MEGFTCYLYSHRGISSVSKSERFNCSTLSINCVFSTFNHTFNIRYSVQSFLLSTCGYCDGFLKLVTMKSLCKLEIPIMLSEESSMQGQKDMSTLVHLILHLRSAQESCDPGNDVNLEMIFLDQHELTQKHSVNLYLPYHNVKKYHSFS